MLRFTLIHYLDGWRLGATVELDAAPQLGTLIKASSDNPDNYSDIYYVDNILWGDGGENYIFVRTYKGYGQRSPLTELDRISSTLDEITRAIDILNDNIMSKLDEKF
jgi:hypothetical protein